MKLPCTLTIFDRNLSCNVNGKKSNRPINSTIALCKHPKADKYCLILFNSNNSKGTKFDINGNIQSVHTKFLNDGKITIQFKNPPRDFFIQANAILMKSFVNILRGILTGTAMPSDTKTMSLSVSVTNNFVAPTKLIIKNRSEYPSKGFPPTLESLTIEGIQRCGLDLGILRLTKLQVLNLSDNNIAKFPAEFSCMKNLKVLDISKNSFHQSSIYNWSWLGGNLCETLVSLNMSKNKLRFVPVFIIKLKNLHSLDVSENQLTEIPNGIGCLKRLKSLKMQHNLLENLPGSIKCLRLEELNIANNRLDQTLRSLINQPLSSTNYIVDPILIEIAAERVLELGLKYDASIIPASLVHFLDMEAKYCTCGKPTFNYVTFRCTEMNLSTISDAVVSSHNTGLTVRIDCYFCSHECARLYSNRGPLVR